MDKVVKGIYISAMLIVLKIYFVKKLMVSTKSLITINFLKSRILCDESLHIDMWKYFCLLDFFNVSIYLSSVLDVGDDFSYCHAQRRKTIKTRSIFKFLLQSPTQSPGVAWLCAQCAPDSSLPRLLFNVFVVPCMEPRARELYSSPNREASLQVEIQKQNKTKVYCFT